MWEKLQEVERRYEDLGAKLSNPEIISDRKLFQKYSKEHSSLTELVATYRAYKKASEELEGSESMLKKEKDSELLKMAEEEARILKAELDGLEQSLKVLLLPRDPNDEKNVILELRAGAGGDEASIFAGDLFRLYCRYAEGKKWKVEVLGAHEGSTGGYKEIIAMLSGERVFSRMKFERGVHRVQRVPETETQGRIHTSTVTVAVLPEAEDIEIEIQDKDLRIDVYRSSGPGGQSVNTTDSAVRITHLPTGIVVAMQDEKSQLKNREKAMKVLKARLLEQKQREQEAEIRDSRRAQVGTGERSEKVRTYNYPQQRVTDHRINLSLHSLAEVMNGDLDQLIDPLTANYQAELLKGERI